MMTLSNFLCGIILCLALVTPNSHGSDNGDVVKYRVEDHLVPVNLAADKNFRLKLESLLFVTPADCGRMVRHPASSGETVVSVYSRAAQSSKQTFFVTVTRARKNLWSALSENSPVHSAETVEIQRLDAELSRPAALAVRKAWETMLSQIKESRDDARPPSDSETVEFSLSGENGFVSWGEAPNRPGKSVLQLIEVGDLLFQFVEASPSRRPRIARKLHQKAMNLAAGEKGVRAKY
jgi:hypothetical protein